jgi:hypothetical protein
MKCDLGHDHPPMEVVGATENPTQPWGPRPYHCPDCFYITKQGAELELAQGRQGLISTKTRLDAIAWTRRQLDRLDA